MTTVGKLVGAATEYRGKSMDRASSPLRIFATDK